MTLTVHDEIDQGSPEWHDQRRGMVTASVVGKLITPSTVKPASNDESRNLTALLVAERITGWTDPTYMNDDMWRGVMHEPIARDKYGEHYAPAVEVGFMVREEDGWGEHGWTLGYSPDGLIGDDGLIEVKCPRAKTHLRTIVANEVPSYNVAQLQAGLLVSGREWIDFISFCAGMPMFVKRVYPDPKWQAAIVAAVAQFETNAADLVAAYREATTGLATTERVDNELGLVF